MYEHKKTARSKQVVVFTDPTTGKKTESPIFKDRSEANAWIREHASFGKSYAANAHRPEGKPSLPPRPISQAINPVSFESDNPVGKMTAADLPSWDLGSNLNAIQYAPPRVSVVESKPVDEEPFVPLDIHIPHVQPLRTRRKRWSGK